MRIRFQPTTEFVLKIIRKHGGAFAQTIVYAKAMMGGEEGRSLPASPDRECVQLESRSKSTSTTES